MNAPTKLATFAVGLLLAFGAAFGVGRAVGPIGESDDPAPSAPTEAVDHDGGHP